MMASDTPATSRNVAAALLDWYGEAGIDAVVDDAPRDRFAETAAELGARAAGRLLPAGTERDEPQVAPPSRLPARAPAVRAATPPRLNDASSDADAGTVQPNEGFAGQRIAVPDEVAVADARERARSAKTLDELRAAMESFSGCNLRLSARSLVFGDGDPDAELMLVGEAPGRDEDAAGAPFVGRSGQLLDRMLAAIGIERASVRLANALPWRPPGNRPPTPAETEICQPFIARQIELVRPKIIVCFGPPVPKAILRTDESILSIRGTWLTYVQGIGPEDAIPLLPMLHPSYLLKQPAQKKHAWSDLLALKAKIEDMRVGSR